MSESPSFEQLAELATERYEHLSDDAPIFVPYLLAGHHNKHDVEASPGVRILTDDQACPYALPHPVNKRLAVLVRPIDATNEDDWLVTIDRISHSESCAACQPLWKNIGSRVSDLVEGEMVYASAPIDSPTGKALLVVDADDLD
ncbi:hypothetical protein [Glutamicibacter ardleyensis]|uniref:hypothetical protein n=1 Tax=Glutamicibacter ardleyensis TaxID=225894 RepID=UPI003FD27CC7